MSIASSFWNLQKELADMDKKVKENQVIKAAKLYGRVQLLLDSLPPSERKLDADENDILVYYYKLYNSSPGFSQKVKLYWRSNMRDESVDRKKLSPELRRALLDAVKQNLRELAFIK